MARENDLKQTTEVLHRAAAELADAEMELKLAQGKMDEARRHYEQTFSLVHDLRVKR